MLNSKLSPWPCFSATEAELVSNVLLSNKVNYWTGQEGREFEREFADFIGVEHAITLANGTLALELALRALGVGEGDEVIVTPRSFLASVSCVLDVGATPVFADIDASTGNLNADTIAAVVTEKTKAVICVHLAGIPCEMDPIMALAEAHNFYVVEDCAQAHGALYKGKKVGAIGHIAAFSFCQDKIMTTGGEGGMLTTNNETFWRDAWAYKDHGKSWAAVYEKKHPPGYRWLHESFGSNYRMTEMQSAIGRYQLTQLPQWLARRSELAARLDAVAKDKSCVRIVEVADHIQVAPYKHNIYVVNDGLAEGWSRDRIQDELFELGVPCFSGGCSEIYLEKAFDGRSFKPKERLPNAKMLGEDTLSMLVHPTITDEQMDWVCEHLAKVLSAASGQ